MGAGSDRAVSIPQITYDHIEDSEKKDDPFFLDEPRGPDEGNHHTQVTVIYVQLIVTNGVITVAG